MTPNERDAIASIEATAHAAFTLAQLALRYPPTKAGEMSKEAQAALAEYVDLHKRKGNTGVADMLTVVLAGAHGAGTYGAGHYSA